MKQLPLILVAVAASVAMGFAQQSTVSLSVAKTSPIDGRQMFTHYCAPCHGVDGKGNGPVTSSLIAKPGDLTQLTKNNGGKFPTAHVIASIEFGQSSPAAHGVRDMPVWGPILNDADAPTSNTRAELKALRERNLESYVASIQGK